jgi:arabinogalactan oligomer/maltooligosaccharide transport system permease protein
LIVLLPFVGSYSGFVISNLFLTSVDSWTMGMGQRNFITGQRSTRWGLFAAAAVQGSTPMRLVFYRFQRYLDSGYTVA